MTTQTPKLLTIDIETLPITASTWGLFDQNIGLSMIQDDWAMLSFAAKWYGKRKTFYDDTRAAAGIRDDKDIVAQLVALLDEADVVIGHNVKKFDMKKLRARAVQHGLKPFREPKIIDTMLMARSVGAFTSNKLEYLTKTLCASHKSGHGKYPGFELWLGVMRNEDAAWAEMKKYNIQDVKVTEQLYEVLRPWARGLPNLGAFYGDEQRRCPRCGSVHVHEHGTVNTNVSEYIQYVCSDCGGYSRDRYTINTKAKRKSLLSI